MKKSLILTAAFCFVFCCNISSAAENGLEPAKVFIKKLRASHPVGTWGILQGEIAHKRRKTDKKSDSIFTKNYSTQHAKIKVGTLFTKLQVVAMIKVDEKTLNDDEAEIYKVGQSYNGDPATIITSNLSHKSLIGNFGISPGDFTMDFLYWGIDNVNQDKTADIKTLKCRIINLVNDKTRERVKVFASIEYYYPLKVQWFHPTGKEPYRTMIIDAFKHKDDLGAPSEISLSGPGWKTKIDFDNIKLGYSKDGNPKDLFE